MTDRTSMRHLLLSGHAEDRSTAFAQPDDAQRPLVASRAAADRAARLRDMVDRYIDFVARVLRNAGTPDAEVDDEVQRTFIIAANRLDDVRPGSEKGFLVGIALNLAAHARRTIARRREVGADQAPEMADGAATPEQLTDRKWARRVLD